MENCKYCGLELEEWMIFSNGKTRQINCCFEGGNRKYEVEDGEYVRVL